MQPVYELTVYAADDTTVSFTLGTDPAHANPYLKVPSSFAEQEVDFAKSAASIGQVTVQAVDVPTVSGDQDTGYITSQLPDPTGYSALSGRRFLLTEDRGSGAETVIDGVCRSVRLMDSFSGYEFEIRDIRERERKTRAFTRTDTPTIVPRGVLNGYGVSVPTGPFFGGSIKLPVPATAPLAAVYRSNSANVGTIQFTGGDADRDRRMIDEVQKAALEAMVPDPPAAYIFQNRKVLWRAAGSGGAYTTLHPLTFSILTALPLGSPLGSNGWQPDGTGAILYLRVDNLVSGGTLPTDGQEIEVIVQYDGPLTEDWPLHIQDKTVGGLLKELYDGDYSDEPPRIRYDEPALLALTTPVRGQIKEPVDDLREWAEKHAYPIAYAAPTLDADGRISPVTYLIPDASATLPDLSNANCAPSGGGWEQGSEDAINVVRVTYAREYGETTDSGTVVTSREVIEEHRDTASIALMGEQLLSVESDLLTAIGNANGGPIFGDQQTEVGASIARQITRMATDRFALGGQYFSLRGSRSDADVEGLRAGSWVTVSVSWMPDYLSGERGLARLAQVQRRRNLDAAWCELTLVDAGSAVAPLGQPTLGTVTADTDGTVSIPVTALATGSPDARVDYAVGATVPATGSGDWTFLDRTAVIATIETPPQSPGATVWVRARSEGVGRRPSAWTTPVSVAIPSTPRVLDVRLRLLSDGTPEVLWTPNAHCAGVVVEYEVHTQDVAPTYPSSVQADAADLSAELPVTVGVQRVLSVRVTPYPGWSGVAVTGTAGPSVTAASVRTGESEPRFEEISHSFTASDELVLDIRTADAGSVRVAVGASRPTDATVDAATLHTTDADGFLSLNMGSGFGAEVVVAARAYENADGTGAQSRVAVSSALKVTYIEAAGGTIGGWGITATDLIAGGATGVRIESDTRRILMGAASAPLTGTGVFLGLDGADWEFRAGNPAGDYIHWDGTDLTISGDINATGGTIGGFGITATDIIAGSGAARLVLESDTQRIMLGAATAPLTGNGIFLGLSGGQYQGRLGNPAGDYLLWDGSALILSGQIIGSGNIVDGAVLTDKINDAAVEYAKLGGRSVDGTKMFVGSFDNLVFNPGFEQDSAELAPWYVIQGSGQTGSTASIGTTSPRSGNRHLVVDTSASTASVSGTSAHILYSASSSGRAAVAEGDRLYVEYWVRKSGPGTAPRVDPGWRFYNAAGGFVSTSHGARVTLTETYQRISRIVTVPSGVAQAVPDLRFADGSTAGITETAYVDDIYARRMVEGSLVVDGTLTAVHIESLSFSGKTATFDTGSIGGWLMSASTLHSAPSGNRITIDAANETITIGAASAPLTGTGIFMGSDGATGYDFRVGDPAGEYIHWDASAGTFEIKAESFTASTPVFDGTLTLQAGAAATRFVFNVDGSDNASLEMYDFNSNNALILTAGSATSTISTGGPRDLFITAGATPSVGAVSIRGDEVAFLVWDGSSALSVADVTTTGIMPGTDSTYDIGTTSVRWREVFGDILNGAAVHIGAGAAGSPPSGLGRLYTASSGTQLWFIDPSGTSTQIV